MRIPKLDRHTTVSSLNSFAAAMLALGIAFALNLDRPYWAMLTVYITSGPFSGAVRSKAIYRLAGTVIGAAVMLVLIPPLVDSPLALCLALSLWIGGCLAVAQLDRTPRSYLTLLAGYTAALIGFPTVGHPEAVFDVAVARVEEIGLGVICAAVMHSLVFPRPVGVVIQANLSRWLANAERSLLSLLQGEGDADSARAHARRALAAAASDVRILASHLPFDTSRLRDARTAVQAMHERMLLLIPQLSALDDQRQALAEAGGLAGSVEARFAEVAAWVRAGAPHAEGVALAADLRVSAAARVGGAWRDLLAESLLIRLAEAVTTLGACHALLGHLRDPDAPLSPEAAAAMAGAVSRPLHRDLGLALRSGATCVVALMIICAVWIGTGWTDGAGAAAFGPLFYALSASFDDPAPAILAFTVDTLKTFVLGAVYVLAILPGIDGFPLLATALLPPLFLFGLYTADPKTTSRGIGLALMFGAAIALQQTVTMDFAAYLNSNLGVYVGLFIALLTTRVLRTISVETSVRRLMRLTRSAIARLARRGAPGEPAQLAALLIDRLALLTPRLALREAGGDAPEHFPVLMNREMLRRFFAGALPHRQTGPTLAGSALAEAALRDLRVAMNLMAIRAAQRELDAADRAQMNAVMDGVMDGLGEHYARLAQHGGERAAPEALLTRLDAALSSVAPTTDAAGRGAALGLLGVRCNLFPTAAPFAVQEQAA